jgi:DNA-binding MarR family transcriptional regulator
MSKSDSIPLAITHDVRDTCLCLHTQRAARALARRFDDALSKVKLSSGQFSLLTALSRPKPPGLGAVATLLAMDRTTLTANLKPLQRRALVKVAVDVDDRRSRLLLLTAKGKRLLGEALPIWRRTHSELDRRFSGRKLRSLRDGLMELSGD